MATFPAITPSTRTRTPGEYPQTAHAAANGREIRIRHSSRTAGDRLRLSFDNITQAQLVSISDHWAAHGRRVRFALSSEVDGGLSLTPTSCSWRYAGPPQASEDTLANLSGHAAGFHSVSVELALVPLPV